ncbi:hypothetical protein J5T34_17030 [Cupriavidus gilardii]|uniref:hypothetical protein n=1 Tax=Cupriavidus gilardii TaxID=82541 RepID=UPI001ABE503A|nr:hypothetical protein [Cupriavidus gilardii]MBO4122432.1 hypothetical protein [Cupriavidus gilardii]
MQTTSTLPIGARTSHSAMLLYLGLGALCAIKVNVIGEVYIGEFIAAAYGLAALSTLRIERGYASFLGLTLMWAFAQALSDLSNATPLTSSIKGVLAPGVFFLTVFAIGTHFSQGSPKRIWYFLIGAALSEIVNLSRAPTEEMLYNPWKWGYAMPVLMLLLCYLSMVRAGALRIALCILAYCAVSVVFDFRSAAGLPLLALAIYLMRRSSVVAWVRSLTHTRGGIPLLFGVLVLVIAALNALFSMIFAHASDFSFLTPEAAHKYTVQATSELGILFGGRSEILISVRAFLDAPLLGHGSWAVDRNGYQDAYSVLVYQMGAALDDKIVVTDDTLIPAHSFLMGALIWSGIVGGLYWICMLARTLWLFVRNMPTMPIFFYVGTAQFVWDVFFSPFSADHRWESALFLGMLFAWHHANGYRQPLRSVR